MTDSQLEKIQQLCDVEEGLHGKELDFIEDISRTDDSEELTMEQADWLQRISERVFG